ncbi:hypothetical protein GRJ2_001667600 [Grus japonensis]|uniref:Uncharacterized protein n=1 Tax=Grus japonensis TaxID=30415 RepID=A0ABC9X2W9_GRUJA
MREVFILTPGTEKKIKVKRTLSDQCPFSGADQKGCRKPSSQASAVKEPNRMCKHQRQSQEGGGNSQSCIYMESSYPMFKEEKSTKVKIHPGAKTLLLDLPDVWLQSRQSDFQVRLLGKQAALGTKQVGGVIAVSPTG